MKPPKTLKVGPVTYQLVVDHDAIAKVERGNAETLFGHHDPRRQTITVDPDQGDDQLADTVLHEVLHAVVCITGLDDTLGELEERVVRSMSTCLLSVIRDNPKLWEWLA